MHILLAALAAVLFHFAPTSGVTHYDVPGGGPSIVAPADVPGGGPSAPQP